MKPMSIILSALVTVGLLAACGEKDEPKPVYEKPLNNPTKVSVEQVPFTNTVKLSWQDNCDNELGYIIWIMHGTEESELVTLNPDSGEYTISSGLTPGETYNIGIQAKAAESKLCSRKVYKSVTLFDYSKLPYIELSDQWTVTPTSAALTYSIKNPNSKYKRLSYGLCWSAEHTPTIEDGHQHGPNYKSSKLTQVITCASMEYGKTYSVRGYVETEYGYTYSNVVRVYLGTPADPIVLTWSEITPEGFPEDVKVYKTTDKLNNRNFNAWYAIADVTKGKVEFRFEFGKSQILEKWYEDSKDKGNVVMTNAGYFNMTTLEVGDFYADKGKITPAKYAANPKGAFAVDEDQNPYVFWTAKDTSGFTYFFNEPEPVIPNVNEYGTVRENYPSVNFVFDPYYAMCAGPLLVKDGKIMADITKDNGSFCRNYELIASDIFTDSSTTPDRTAVGYTADGKIILFVCDGRIQQSRGASILEIAQLMKGLGCEGAVNFDGGGSTAMTLKGVRINSLDSNMPNSQGVVPTENRPVGTVMGFYVK